MPKIFQKTEGITEGKFLVVRRDGTIPEWPHFVLGARDPVADRALAYYALHARKQWPNDPAYSTSVLDLAGDFRFYRHTKGEGDPPAGPHRKDNPAIVRLMRREGDLTTYGWQPIETAPRDGTVVDLWVPTHFGHPCRVVDYFWGGTAEKWLPDGYLDAGDLMDGHISHWMHIPKAP